MTISLDRAVGLLIVLIFLAQGTVHLDDRRSEKDTDSGSSSAYFFLSGGYIPFVSFMLQVRSLLF